MNYSFPRYLSAKKTVDDRSLNHLVWKALRRQVQRIPAPLRILEVGAGVGAMLERMLDWGLISRAEYTGIDVQLENIVEALARLPDWAQTHAYQVERPGQGKLILTNNRQDVGVTFESIDLFDFIKRENGRQIWDLLVAHAFLDLIDISASLPQMFALLKPGGLFYFTINFDGLTILEPVIDPALDDLIITLYQRSMEERTIQGKPSGDSRAGRHLFTHLDAAGAEVLEAGASDWVVFPRKGTYPADEAYFLHYILHFFDESLRGHPELEPQRFERWLVERHAQVERGELIYIAHQLDFFGVYHG